MADSSPENEPVVKGSERIAGIGEVRSGYIQRNEGSPVLVDYEVLNGHAVFEGDIILGPADDT